MQNFRCGVIISTRERRHAVLHLQLTFFIREHDLERSLEVRRVCNPLDLMQRVRYDVLPAHVHHQGALIRIVPVTTEDVVVVTIVRVIGVHQLLLLARRLAQQDATEARSIEQERERRESELARQEDTSRVRIHRWRRI
jgi:hypothetical protein